MDSTQPREAISSKDIGKIVLIYNTEQKKWQNLKARLCGILHQKQKLIVKIGPQEYYLHMKYARILEPRPS